MGAVCPNRSKSSAESVSSLGQAKVQDPVSVSFVTLQGADGDAAIKACADEIRRLKEKLKADGASGETIRENDELQALLQKLRGMGVAGAAAKSDGAAETLGSFDGTWIQGKSKFDLPKDKQKLRFMDLGGGQCSLTEPKQTYVGQMSLNQQFITWDDESSWQRQKVDKYAKRGHAFKSLLRKVQKEGGKRGVEIEGAADMGGLQFFCCSVDLPEGDLELLDESLNSMNELAIPGDEERKGCSGHIGKTIFSAGVDQLGVVAYVPQDKVDELNCEEWLKATLAIFQGEVVSVGQQVCAGRVKADGDKGIFPLKIREAMILEANNFLRKKGLFPEDKDDSDEMVFGDDDFPS